MAAEAAIGLVRSRLARNLQASANPQALLPGCCLGTTVTPRRRVGPGAVKESGYEARLELSGVPFGHKKGGKCEIRPDLGSLPAGWVEKADLMDNAARPRWTQTDLVFHRKQRRRRRSGRGGVLRLGAATGPLIASRRSRNSQSRHTRPWLGSAGRAGRPGPPA